MKTTQEAAEDCALMPGFSEQYAAGKLAGFKDGVEFAQRWIPVSEELPKKHIDILVTDGTCYSVCEFNGNEFKDLHYSIFYPTHWRPINLK